MHLATMEAQLNDLNMFELSFFFHSVRIQLNKGSQF